MIDVAILATSIISFFHSPNFSQYYNSNERSISFELETSKRIILEFISRSKNSSITINNEDERLVQIQLREVFGWDIYSNIAMHYVDGNTAILQLVGEEDCSMNEQIVDSNAV